MVRKKALFDAPEADPKVTKQEFAYVNDKSNPRCGACNMYLETGKCTLVEGDIDPEYGECTYWAYRRTKPIVGKKYEPMLDKKEAGYYETPKVGLLDGGSYCGICKFYTGDVNGGKCEMVEGDIDYTGCCIAWTPNEEAEDATISAENYKKIFKFYGKVDLS